MSARYVLSIRLIAIDENITERPDFDPTNLPNYGSTLLDHDTVVWSAIKPALNMYDILTRRTAEAYERAEHELPE